MKIYILAIIGILAVGIVSVISVDQITGNYVYKENPCHLIDCNVRIFGFQKLPAEFIGDDEDGLAMCHCPQESPDQIYRISHWTKY
jgi:hypothetical protein